MTDLGVTIFFGRKLSAFPIEKSELVGSKVKSIDKS